MIILADFSVIRPDPGLLIWTSLIFLLFWVLIGKFAFKPIANALRTREDSIRDALASADNARSEMENLQSKNEELIDMAREERSKILKEAKDAKDQIVSEAKVKAKEEAALVISNAMNEIEAQKKSAIEEVKNSVGNIALEIAEKVIQKELKGDKENEKFVQTLIDDIKLS